MILKPLPKHWVFSLTFVYPVTHTSFIAELFSVGKISVENYNLLWLHLHYDSIPVNFIELLSYEEKTKSHGARNQRFHAMRFTLLVVTKTQTMKAPFPQPNPQAALYSLGAPSVTNIYVQTLWPRAQGPPRMLTGRQEVFSSHDPI